MPTAPNSILSHKTHRPYPMPQASWLMYQSWQRLLFAHWEIPISALRDKIPPELEIDTYEGKAWLGVVPFRMANVRFRGLAPVWGTSHFPELNLRTYVKKDGYAGVWFFSLDAANFLAVQVAKVAFHLPYYRAKMSIHEDGKQTHYHSARDNALFIADYAPTGEVQAYPSDSLERWLTERYCLFAVDKQGKIFRGDIQHQQWALQPAEAIIHKNTIAEASGLSLANTPPHLLYVEQLDVLAWYLK